MMLFPIDRQALFAAYERLESGDSEDDMKPPEPLVNHCRALRCKASFTSSASLAEHGHR